MITVLGVYDLVAPVTLFDLAEHGTNNTMYGVRSGGDSFVLKSFEAGGDRGRLQYEHRLLSWLGERELPFAVAVPIPARDGRTLIDRDDYRYALYPLLPGRQPDEGNAIQIHAFGAALGELHIALADFPPHRAAGHWRYDELEHVHTAIPDPYNLTPQAIGLPDEPPIDELCTWWRAELAELQPFIAGRYPDLPRQVIHGDYCPSNTLFDGDRLTAVLDFEFALPDARAMDLASGLQFTLRPWLEVPHWQQAHAFVDGYASVAELDPGEIAALPELMRLRNVVSGVWWLGRFLANGTPERSLGRLEWIRDCNTYIDRNRARLLGMLQGPR